MILIAVSYAYRSKVAFSYMSFLDSSSIPAAGSALLLSSSSSSSSSSPSCWISRTISFADSSTRILKWLTSFHVAYGSVSTQTHQRNEARSDLRP